MEVTVLVKRVVLLDGEEVPRETLLNVLNKPNHGGYWDFDDNLALTYTHACALEAIGVLNKHEDAVFYAGPNYNKFMNALMALRLNPATEVISL